MLTCYKFPQTSLSILFADDSALDATLLRHGFRAAEIECNIHHVETGAAAHQWLASNPVPDAVVLDFRLASDSGLDVLIALQNRPELRSVPKVILSGMRPAHLETEISAHGGYLLEKPLELAGWEHIARAMHAYRRP